MRWDNLRLDGSPAQLPLLERGAVTRTFDTPGFRGMTFYEVQAKSIVSRVPESSRVPFTWTINPYRGCQHGCVYCISGDTPVLIAGGTTRSIADLHVGDKIYGTVRDGWYRRYAVTEVLAHWSTVKPAYRITLEDGTQLIASGDHRFLTERGWKHVTGAGRGPDQRPFLTVNNKLMGTGGFAEPPKESSAYRRGYLCGMIRGDANLASYTYSRGDVHRFRLALADAEALNRGRRFLGTFGVITEDFESSQASGPRRAMRAIRTSSHGNIQAIRHLIEWPAHPCEDWHKGFLAGIFDAEGSYSQGAWRVTNTDQEIIDWTVRALASLGVGYA
jgi:hypothetical protein